MVAFPGHPKVSFSVHPFSNPQFNFRLHLRLTPNTFHHKQTTEPKPNTKKKKKKRRRKYLAGFCLHETVATSTLYGSTPTLMRCLFSFKTSRSIDSSPSNSTRGSNSGRRLDRRNARKNDDDSSSSTTGTSSNTSPYERICWKATSWEKGDFLGRGTFGSVYEGISDNGFFFAVKEVSLLDQGTMGRQSISQLEQEIDLLSQFKHENIVRYYGTAKDDSKLYIFLELVTKGSLLNLYRKYNLRESQVSAYTRQILHGLKYLHNRNVIHRDIKCANLLVGTDGSVKLADFGLAKASRLNDVKSCHGTVFWMAPEVVRAKDHGYGLPADIWSLGCTVLEMLTGQFPYAPLECMQALFRIGRGEPPSVPETLSNDARDFILKCVQVNPDDRPIAAQLLNHPFVRPLPGALGSTSPNQLGRRLST